MIATGDDNLNPHHFVGRAPRMQSSSVMTTSEERLSRMPKKNAGHAPLSAS